ncbi:MAG: tRNA pseudouridine(54/55) synthase Pus10 [Methanomassiliicoccales archaeon]|jgi:tRNA pseudouridine synthase 10|nr:tRNA pseudouridine(54/55) synthase Pus10 [Methanomassiliicoccales archaeon]
MNELAARAEKALSQDLCDHCLGRLFARVDTGLSNSERGESLRMAVALERALQDKEPLPPHSKCAVCEDLFDMVPRFAEAVVEKLQPLEFETFLVGTRIDPIIVEREERLWGVVGQDKAETIKAEMNQEIGKAVQSRIPHEVEFTTPDVVALVDTRFCHVELDISPLFVYGRYRKFSREIPQTRWPCNRCRGKGCSKCGGTGKMYQTSVQEHIGGPLQREAQGKDHFFHGMGREDIDARMLGNGRPFVLEVREPVRRQIDLLAIENEVNEVGRGVVEVTGLRFSTREEVRRVKLASPDKEYRVRIRLESKVNKEQLDEVVQSLKRIRITQQTPTRVSHRRADLAREREIKDLVLEEFDGASATLRVRTESGTYVKEFVHGDSGRTVPSLAGKLGIPCTVECLDVIEIADQS